MRSRTAAPILALMLMVILATPVAAGQPRPMKGTFTGSPAMVDQRCGDAALTLGYTLSGEATHLGRFSGSGSNCTEFSLASDAVAIWDGLVTIEAADGSTLTLSSEGMQNAPVAGVASYAHTDIVLAGTGRFADAEGVLTVSGQIDFTTGTITGSVAGWLSY